MNSINQRCVIVCRLIILNVYYSYYNGLKLIINNSVKQKAQCLTIVTICFLNDQQVCFRIPVYCRSVLYFSIYMILSKMFPMLTAYRAPES